MFFSRKLISFGFVAAMVVVGLIGTRAQAQESGYQTIDGTRVYTKIDHASQQATFSNECGSQTISRSALQAGAKPTNIIPCPRPQARETPRESPSSRDADTGLLWGAIAAGIQTGRVSVGSALNHSSESAARNAAIRKCEENGISCKSVGTFTKCGFVTVSKNAENVAWGAGPTAQAAYNNCYSKVVGGNCDPHTIGGCNKN
jgi:hypothetical protein